MPSVNPRTRGNADNSYFPHNRIMTIREWCERTTVSEVTGWRILKSGNGPTVTRISQRRIGIREDHNAEWLESPESPLSGAVPKRRGPRDGSDRPRSPEIHVGIGNTTVSKAQPRPTQAAAREDGRAK